MDKYSPVPMEKAPATRPARPASRTTSCPGLAPAKPRMSDTLVTNPSRRPKSAARNPPSLIWRWCGSLTIALTQGVYEGVLARVGKCGLKDKVFLEVGHDNEREQH